MKYCFRNVVSAFICCCKITTVVLFAFILSYNTDLKAQTPKKQTSVEEILVKHYYYVASYVSWPNGKELQEVNFCIERGHFLHSSFSKFLPKKKILGKKTNLMFFDLNDKGSQQNCNIIVINGDRKLNSSVIENVKDLPILTMSSEDDITRNGGLVYIPADLSKKAPKVSMSAFKSSNLTLHPTLLNFSTKIWGNKQSG